MSLIDNIDNLGAGRLVSMDSTRRFDEVQSNTYTVNGATFRLDTVGSELRYVETREWLGVTSGAAYQAVLNASKYSFIPTVNSWATPNPSIHYPALSVSRSLQCQARELSIPVHSYSVTATTETVIRMTELISAGSSGGTTPFPNGGYASVASGKKTYPFNVTLTAGSTPNSTLYPFTWTTFAAYRFYNTGFEPDYGLWGETLTTAGSTKVRTISAPCIVVSSTWIQAWGGWAVNSGYVWVYF